MTTAHAREAQIILPQETNSGTELTRLLQALQVELVDTFGGCTILSGYGAWKAPNGQMLGEPVFLFTVAYATDPLKDAQLLGIAQSYGTRAGQHTVYVRTPDGAVQFLELNTEPLDAFAPQAAGMLQAV